ncbi:MAG TPA: PQQ-dependent sugar dehydrogenase [Patescibacteria group bacterium]|nr:PQQ-dependent sugar dehydrogenase [Patescibacteria group bacterium]
MFVAIAIVTTLVGACGGTGSPTRSGPSDIPSARAGSPSPGPLASTGPSSGPSSGASVPADTSAAPPGGPFDPARVRVAVEPVAAGLDAPLAVVDAGDGSDRLFVAEQGGRIRIIRAGALVARPFLDIAGRISSGGERGLLGLAFHPDFPVDPRFFVDYTDPQGNTRISSFTVDPASPDRADPATERRLLFVRQPYPNHNGGAVAFGPDGFLVVALGDGGGGGDPEGNGQDLSALLGKILRIDVDATAVDRPYAIPADNPYADGAGNRRPEIWLAGLRNPWRLSFDRLTGDLWIGDVGQGDREEIDVQRAGAPGGTNFGWNRREGTACYRSGCDDPALTDPITEYDHDQGCTVIGGNVYRGSAQAALAGGYVFGDYCTGRLWAIDPTTNDFRAPTAVGEMGPGLSSFGEDAAGELYATDIAGGRLLRVTATSR